MVLWTLQQPDFLGALEAAGRLHASWDRVSPQSWRPAYRWMSDEMVRQGIRSRGNPPVWLWHSCNGWRRPPGPATIEMYVCDAERRGIVLTVDIPDDLALLSAYGPWNEVLVAADGGPSSVGERAEALRERLFDISGLEGRRWRDGRHDVQACVPYLDREWLVEVRPYDLDSTPSQGPA